MAEQQVRVLLIEDNPADARLIRELLAETFGADLDLQTADRLSAGLDRLAQGGVDVVLLDLGLPDSQGIDTFVSLCAQAPETPVVVLTGLDDEMVAAQAAREGAQDYLIKGQGDSRSLKRALNYAIERKRAEEAVRRSEEHYRALVENMNEVVYRVGIGPDPLQGPIQFVSDAIEQALGYRPEEFYQDPGLWFRSISPEDVAAVWETTQQMLLRHERCIRTYRLLPKAGREYRWFEDRVAPIFDSNGHIVALQGVARDVTENIEAEETLRLRNQEMETRASIAGIVAQPGTLEDKATQVLMQLVQVVQADHAVLRVSDEEGRELRWLTSTGVSGREPAILPLTVPGQGLTGLAIQQGEPVLANDYASHPLALPELVAAGRKSSIALPIQAGRRLQGIVSVSSDTAGHFTPERVHLLTAIAGGIGALLENARLQEEERLHAQELEALSIIAGVLAQPGTLEDRATQVLMQLVQAVQADHATLAVSDKEGQDLRLLTSVGISGKVTPLVTLPQLSQGLSALVLQQGEPVLANDYASHPRALPELVAAGRRALIALPIRSGDRVLGVIAVSSEKTCHFTPARVRLLTAIAGGIGALLENARLQDEERLRTEDLEAMGTIASILAQPGGLEEKATQALEELVRIVMASNAVLRVRDDKEGALHLVATAGESEPSLPPLLSYGQGVTGQAFQTEEIVIANDYASRSQALSRAVSAGRMSLVALPIKNQGQTIGTVAVASNQFDHFTPGRVRLLTAIADGLGPLLENARLREEERLRTQELEVLLSLGGILARTGSFEEKVSLILQDLVRAVQADSSALSVPDEDLHGLRAVAAAGAAGPTLPPVPLIPYGQGLQGAAFERREPIVANDYASFPGSLPGIVETGRRAGVALPIRVGDRVLGVIVVGSEVVNHFTDDRVRLLTAIADGMGSLLENARLQEEERLRVIELATANQQLQSEVAVRTLAEEEVARSVTRLQQVLDGIVRAMASAVEVRDPYTAGHQQRVARLAIAISRRMGLTEDQQEAIRIAALLHDVGKIAVPSELLTKPGALSELEFAIIKTHPQVGYNMLETIEFPWDIATIVSQHHERLNGSGYPFRLAGDQITLEARVLAVADVVEAMASHRPYRPALGVEAGLAEIRQNRGVLFEPAVVDACLELFATSGFQLK